MKAGTIVSPMIATLIILALLLIVFAAYPQGVISILERYNLLTPKDNPDNAQVKPELFRYDIEKDVVEYYDGSFFTDFKDDAKKVNDKRVSYDGIYNDLNNYYYDTERKSSAETETRLSINSARKMEHYLPLDLCIEVQKIVKEKTSSSEKGEIIILLHNVEGGGQTPKFCTDKIFGLFTLKPDLKLTLRKINEDKYKDGELFLDSPETITQFTHQSLYSEIVGFGLSWRNSILSKPITIGYEKKIDKDNYISESGTFCTSITDNIYLVVDISQPKSQC